MTLIATTQPFSEASRLNYSYQIKQQLPFPLSSWKLNNHVFQQSSLFQVAQSLLEVELQLSVSHSHAG